MPNHLSPRTAACFAFACIAPFTQGFAKEPGAHAHGQAELRVAVDGNQLEVTLESPLDNVLGFERAPRNDKERSAVRAMALKLRQAQTLFVPTPEARCTLASVQIASAVLAPQLLGEASSATTPGANPDGHADLDATFQWRCTEPAQLTSLDVRLMQAFSGLRKLNVQVAGPRGQSAMQVSHGQRVVVKW